MTLDKVNSFDLSYLTKNIPSAFTGTGGSVDMPLLFDQTYSNNPFNSNIDIFGTGADAFAMPASGMDFGMNLGFMPQNNFFNFTMPNLNIDFSQFNINNMFGNNKNLALGIDKLYSDFTASLDEMYKNQLLQFSNMFSMFSPKAANLNNVTYNQQKAQQIAQNVLANAGSQSQSRCAEYVSDALENAGLHFSRGHAYQMENNLRNSKDFKEVSITKDQLASLPAGCIIVYPQGAAGYSSKYGHIEITLGDGRTASDFVNSNPKYSDQMKVFVPV